MLFAPEEVKERHDDGELPVENAGRCRVEAVDVHGQEGQEVGEHGDGHGGAGETGEADEVDYMR